MITGCLTGKLWIIGFGSIGQGVLPLILRHIEISPQNICIIAADDNGAKFAAENGVLHQVVRLTPDNYYEYLTAVQSGDFLLNVSVEVSSLALMELCYARGALYLDTCIEPWAGGYTDTSLTPAERSNYALREDVLAFKTRFPKGPTAIPAHGANPGLISHWVKQGLLNIARDKNRLVRVPQTRLEWAKLAKDLGLKVIHCSERDTQSSCVPKRREEFVNTWSVEGFISEGCQPAELGWGTHEKRLPADGCKHTHGSQAAIYLNRPGMCTQVRTWTPNEGPFHGFLITHGEAISIADYFTLRVGDTCIYRPTVHYAYHPCDAAVLSIHEMAGKNLKLPKTQRLIGSEIVEGSDELGVLLMGDFGAYWYGSTLSIEEARNCAPQNSATSLQVAAGVLAGMLWAIHHPNAGVLEPDELPFEVLLEWASPYLGKVSGSYTDWTPLEDRGVLFEENLDRKDPWQFSNFRVQEVANVRVRPEYEQSRWSFAVSSRLKRVSLSAKNREQLQEN